MCSPASTVIDTMLCSQADQAAAAEDSAGQTSDESRVQGVRLHPHTWLWCVMVCFCFTYRKLRVLLSAQKEVESLSNELVAYWEVRLRGKGWACIAIPMVVLLSVLNEGWLC